MKNNKGSHIALLLTILIARIAAPVVAQSPFDPDRWDQARKIEEHLQVFTDRSIYAVDEAIHFFADHRVSGIEEENLWSRVLYVELVASTGEALARGKYKLIEGKAEGTLRIPGAALTGNYYLKSYTRWMRNSGPGSFSYIPLKIVNPNRADVIGSSDRENAEASLQKVIFKNDMLECRTDAMVYKSGKEGLLKVKAIQDIFPDLFTCCVTVVPEGSIDLTGGQYQNKPPSENDSFRVTFLPDLGEGVSISGTVTGPDQEPVSLATLHFSLLGEEPDYFAAMPDKYGRFVINVPNRVGEDNEFFVTPEQDQGQQLDVRIDQEFDPRLPGFPVERFSLSGEEEEIARKIALNVQLSKVFKTEVPSQEAGTGKDSADPKGLPFYGSRVKHLLIDDYVRLPNLEEIFINLMPEVQFYRLKGKKRIRILSENNSIGVYKPLIMIDNISIFDHEALLALSPEKIEHIDLIDDIYLKGNVAFGGVLAVYSRKGDMAGIDLPDGSYFFDYQSFYPDPPSAPPPPPQESRIPDSRNTYFWAGNLLMEKGNQMDIPFHVPGIAGNYVVLVRGVAPSGSVYSATGHFRVE